MSAEKTDGLGLLAQAFAHQQGGRFDDAEALYARVLAASPDDATALVNAGVLAMARGDLARAISRLERATGVAPRNAIALDNLGLALLHASRLEDALATLDRAIAVQPQLATAHNHRGIALLRLRRVAEARRAFALALTHNPRLLVAALNLGEQANAAGDALAAATAYDRVLAAEPGNVHAATGRAFATALGGDLDAASRALEDIVVRAPTHVAAWQTLGAVRNFAWNHDGAEAAFQRVLALAPELADAGFGVASARLGRGDFGAGWAAFERRADRGASAGAALATLPQWDGTTRAGTLLVYGEQGYGDVLQFARFLSRARARVGGLVLLLAEDHTALAPLLATVAGVDRVITRVEDVASANAQARVSLLSLPHRLQVGADALGMTAPYVATPPERRVAWSGRLAPLRRPRVGLAWSVLARDVHGFVTLQKSLPPRVLAPLLARGDASFVTLQPGAQGDPAVFGRDAGALLDVRKNLRDFADTAALVEELDLVICPDTAVAHLAGAMGKPVWMLDRYNTCWRWRGGAEATPWYPSMRIFRQSRFGNWDDVGPRLETAYTAWRAGMESAPPT